MTDSPIFYFKCNLANRAIEQIQAQALLRIVEDVEVACHPEVEETYLPDDLMWTVRDYQWTREEYD